MTDILTTNVLLLNRHYTPIGTISVKDAFCKFWAGVAEAVLVSEQGTFESYGFESWADISNYRELFKDSDPEWIHTPSMTLLIPRILRTLTYEKQKINNIKPSRRNIYDRDRYTCQYCNKKFSLKKLNLDHVIPRCQGGKSSWKNLVCTCIPCNSLKGGRNPKEAEMKLIRVPIVPPPSYGFKLPEGTKKYKDWNHFISEAYWTMPLEP